MIQETLARSSRPGAEFASRSGRAAKSESDKLASKVEGEDHSEIKRRLNRIQGVVEQKMRAEEGYARKIINKFRPGKNRTLDELIFQQQFIRDASFNLSNSQISPDQVDYINQLYTAYQQEQASALQAKSPAAENLGTLLEQMNSRPEMVGANQEQKLALLRKNIERKIGSLQEKLLEAWPWNKKQIEIELWQAQLTIDTICEELQRSRERTQAAKAEEAPTVPLNRESTTLSADAQSIVQTVESMVQQEVPVEQWSSELNQYPRPALEELRERVGVELGLVAQELDVQLTEVGGERVTNLPAEFQKLLNGLAASPIDVGWITTPAALSQEGRPLGDSLTIAMTYLREQRRHLQTQMEQALAEQRAFVYAQNYQMPKFRGQEMNARTASVNTIDRLGEQGQPREDRIRQAGYDLALDVPLDKVKIRQRLATLWDKHQKLQRWSKRAELIHQQLDTMQTLYRRAQQRVGQERFTQSVQAVEQLQQRYTLLQGYCRALERAGVERRTPAENVNALAQALDTMEDTALALTDDSAEQQTFQVLMDELAEAAGSNFEVSL